jgi:DNA primase
VSADVLLSRLDKVRQTGPGRWLARCSAHEDKSPSLSVRELDDGRVLVHCFAGCGIEEILGALGLEFDALFPEKLIEHGKRERRPFPANDVLRALADESLLVAVAAANLGQKIELTDADRERLILAAARIQAGRSLALGE